MMILPGLHPSLLKNECVCDFLPSSLNDTTAQGISRSAIFLSPKQYWNISCLALSEYLARKGFIARQGLCAKICDDDDDDYDDDGDDDDGGGDDCDDCGSDST